MAFSWRGEVSFHIQSHLEVVAAGVGWDGGLGGRRKGKEEATWLAELLIWIYFPFRETLVVLLGTGHGYHRTRGKPLLVCSLYLTNLTHIKEGPASCRSPELAT